MHQRGVLEGRAALVIGGARGLGEAIVLDLLRRGCSKVTVADCRQSLLCNQRVESVLVDLSVDRVESLRAYVEEADVIVVTAGIGRLDHFDSFDLGEVERTMRVNATAAMEIIQMAAARLASPDPFYLAVITSIAGLVSSPLYAVYSASKGALSRYVEAVNAELAGRELENRILEVAPGRIDGTGFHGGEQRGPELLMSLAGDVVDAMLSRQMRLIPDSSTYEAVIARYQGDPVAFAESSLHYKLGHVRLEHTRLATVGYLSGTFDLFHVGHLNLLRRARARCDRLVVGVHPSGAWKGKETFIPLDERKALISACRYVDEVIDAPDEDNEAWEVVHYDLLFVGSDYKGTPRFARYERELGARGVKIIYFPYTAGTSSTQIRAAISGKLDAKSVG